MHQTMMGFRRDSDGVRGRRIERAVLRRVLRTVRPYRRLVIGFIICVVAGAAASAIPPLLFRSLLDTAIPEHDRGLLTALAIGAVALAFASAVLSLIQRWLSSRIGEGLIYDLRVRLFDHVQGLPLAFFTRTQTGALQSRLNNDVVGAQQAVTNTLGTVVANGISLIVTLSIMLALEWRLTILTLIVLPAFIYPARKIGAPLQKLFRESMQLNAEMNTTIAERFNVSGAMLVKLFGRPERERDEFAMRAARVRDNGVRSALYGRVLFVVLGLVAAVGTAVVYWVGGSLAIDDTLRAGTVAAFVLYVGQIYQPLAQLTNTRVDVLSALVSFERVFEVLDFEPSIIDRPGAFDLIEPRGEVEFDTVWFRHPAAEEVSIASLEGAGVGVGAEASDWILQNISFSIAPGELVALVGPSGAGKSTIASLVSRLHDATQGAVRIDGHDVRDLTQASLRAAIGVVAQDPHLFHESIEANLRYARPDATDTDIWDALRAAQIDDLVASLPDRLETIVGERGYRMSGGEKQRLAIARLLLKDPAIVILDEATSHLDADSESEIQAAFASALVGRSSLVIAHRLSTVMHADRILVVDNGQIVEQGRHDDLLAADGLYAQLTRTQLAQPVP
jgi:ATP-binding cassette subfamily B protein